MIAAEMTGRSCYGIELSPEYSALAIAHWEQLTGRRAKLIESRASGLGPAFRLGAGGRRM